MICGDFQPFVRSTTTLPKHCHMDLQIKQDSIILLNTEFTEKGEAKRTDTTDDLYRVFGFHTEDEFIRKSKLKFIIKQNDEKIARIQYNNKNAVSPQYLRYYSIFNSFKL